MAVNNLNRDRLLALTDTDPRHRVTHYLLNGRPYEGAMHPIFHKGKIAPTYMTGPRHHEFSEYLVYSVRPILIDTIPQIDLPRLPREPKNIYTAYKDAGVYDDVLNNVSGQPVLNRSIIPARMVTPLLSGRDRPSNSNTTQGFVNPRGAVSGGRGDQVFYSRVPLSTAVQGPPIIPNSSGVLPPDQRPQPPYGVVRGFQAPPIVAVAPLRPPAAPMTPFRPLFGPPQPIDFIRSQQGSSSSQRQSQQPPPLAFIPTSLAGPSTVSSSAPTSAPTSAATKGPPSPSTPPVSYETGTSRGSGSRTARPAGVNKQKVMARQVDIERLNIDFSAADYATMRLMSDRRNFRPSPAEEEEQRQRLVDYPELMRPILDRYGDLQNIRARIAIGAVYGVHKSIVP
ncbi:hypothetical protein T492DRAFT_840998 [Pavlovales sp. CCMP2436]|nr:hypothetical protein T492DRAFT_840998 [Pavlovales sp. CCMP2436]